MEAVTFGELLGRASGHIETAASLTDAEVEPRRVGATVRQGRQLVAAIARFLDDVIAEEPVEVIMKRQAGTQLHTALHVREALSIVSESLGVAGEHTPAAGGLRRPLTVGLADASTCLKAGRDLLKTHFVTGPDGIRDPASHWAPAVQSALFTGALLEEVAGLVRRAASWAQVMSDAVAGAEAVADVVHRELGSACQWLLFAAYGVDRLHRSAPVTAEARMLLRAVPVNVVPAARRPGDGEPVAVQCEEIAVSAARLRALSMQPATEGAWAPQFTADSWRWTATATAVAGDLSEIVLRALADQCGEGEAGGAGVLLASAARAAAEARDCWRHVAASWGEITTEARGLVGPVVGDAGDLVLRLGRLAFADPQWEPTRSRSAVIRDPVELASGAGEVRVVLAAVHEAGDALARTARYQAATVFAAVRAQRLYVPTRALPADDRVTGLRRFGRARERDVFALREAYVVAVKASEGLADALDTAAVAAGAPSRVLAVARGAPRASGDQAELAVGRLGRGRGGSAEERLTARMSVEDQVYGLGVRNPLMLLRGRALDRAVVQLVDEALAVTSRRRATGGRGARRRRGQAGGTVPMIAAGSFPQQVLGAAGHSSGRAGLQVRGAVPGQRIVPRSAGTH